jgi:hypothetical protein
MKDVKSWNDITVSQYQEMMMIDTTNEITKFVEQISICLDVDTEEVRAMSYSEYKELQSKMSFLCLEPKAEMDLIIEVEGRKYGLIPDMSLISAGVFIDAEQFKLEPMENLHNLLALIYRPVLRELPDGEYEIEEHKAQGFEKRANLFKTLSIETVLGAVLFFSLLGTESSIAFLSYSSQVMMEQQESLMKTTKTQTPTKKRKQKRSTGTTASTI